jgi:tyrosine ammonia-lyase
VSKHEFDAMSLPLLQSASVVLRPDEAVSLEAFGQLVLERVPVTLSDATRARVQRAKDALDALVADRALIYGVTTGYGPLATEYIAPEQCETLQRNLIYHLCAGVGEPFSDLHTRAIMAARLISLSQGYSALRPKTLERLATFLNRNILPEIPEMGTVGASGDLTPLAHMALTLLGEGFVRYEGRRRSSVEVLAECGLPPLTLEAKEGLALVNGTSAMTGVAAVNAVFARRLHDWRLSVLFAELMSAKADAYHPLLAQVRPHPGQLAVVERLRALTAGSTRLQGDGGRPARLAPGSGADDGILHAQAIVQDPYTLRCVPQIYGAIEDVLRFHDGIVTTELNAVTDNPVFFPAAEQDDDCLVLHGGNFYGQHVAFASDALAGAVTKLALHAERVVARITDPKLNGERFPAFLQADRLGLQSGLMGAQVTASAVVAEMRALATPAAIQSVPTNANNQDVVSMGTIAARKAAKALDLACYVLAVEALALVQAFELAGGFQPETGRTFSPASQRLARWLREQVAFISEDRPLAPDLSALAAGLRQSPAILERQ